MKNCFMIRMKLVHIQGTYHTNEGWEGMKSEACDILNDVLAF